MQRLTRLAARTLGPGVAAKAKAPLPDAFAEKILDAALQEIAAVGMRRLTLVDVAQRAGVGRVTVYRRFADRESLLDALAQRESQRFYAAVSEAVSRAKTPEERFTEGFVTYMRFVRTHPVLRRLVSTEPEMLVQYVLGDDALAFRLGRDFIAAHILPTKTMDEAQAQRAAETLVRVAISFLFSLPSAVALDDEHAVRAYARTCLLPIVEHGGSSGNSRPRRRA